MSIENKKMLNDKIKLSILLNIFNSFVLYKYIDITKRKTVFLHLL